VSPRRGWSGLLLLILVAAVSMGQERTPRESVTARGREALIDRATARIQRSGKFQGFDQANFDRTRVWTDGDYTWVTFGTSVRFAPRNSSTIFAITVFVQGQNAYSYAELRNPESTDAPTVVYSGNNKYELEVAGLLEKIGFKSGVPDGVIITISERANHYEIEEMSGYSGSIYKLRKLTWKIYDEVHEDLAIDPDDSTEEIK
jgi:hypothetical protein